MPEPAIRRGDQGCRASLGCAAIAALLLLSVAIGLAYFIYNYDTIASRTVSHAAVQMVEASGLPEAERQRLTARIVELRDAWQAGRISQQRAANAFEELVPLLYVAMIQGYQPRVEASALPAEEKAALVEALDRLARAAHTGAVPLETVQAAFAPVSGATEGGAFRLEPSPSPEQLRALLESARAAADGANIPPGPFEIDVAAEADRVVDAALRGGAGAPRVPQE